MQIAQNMMQTVRPLPPPMAEGPVRVWEPRFEPLPGFFNNEVPALIRDVLRTDRSIGPIHRLLAGAPPSVNIVGAAEIADKVRGDFYKEMPAEAVQGLADLHTSKLPFTLKSIVAGAGLVGAGLFQQSAILPPPESSFAAGLIIFMTLTALPILGSELTFRRLRREFELMPVRSRYLPSLHDILHHGYTAAQFRSFVKRDLAPRLPRGYARSIAAECGTCLRDIRRWGTDDLWFAEASWKSVYNTLIKCGVDDETGMRVKAALLIIEQDRIAPDDPSCTEVQEALATLREELA